MNINWEKLLVALILDLFVLVIINALIAFVGISETSAYGSMIIWFLICISLDVSPKSED